MVAQENHYTPERLRLFAIRAEHNHDVVFIFMGLVLGLVGSFILFHLLRLLGQKLHIGQGSSKMPQPIVRFSRKIRNVSIRKAPGFPSIGHAGVVLIYVTINIVLTFTHLSAHSLGMLSNLASRTAWMAIANLVVVICLAMKNTPLAYLAWSYERLNVLHRVAGFTTFVFIVFHASFYSSYFVQAGRSSRLLYTEEIFGMVAAGCLLLLVFSGVVVRAWWYELFYYMHISSWVVGIVTLGLHQPEFSKKIIFVTLVVGGIWVLDRLVRLASLALNSVSNEVTLHPLSNGGTRVSLKKPPLGAVAGKHCFLWIPKIRSCETHPFTIAATDPLEFVIASYDGFTGDLHRFASAHPGISLKASVDGVYGTFPDVIGYDTTILIAGGSGASFTFGTALSALKRMSPDERKKIIFVWMVKQHVQFTWFSGHLKTLDADGRVSLRLYVTRPPTLEMSPSLSGPEETQDKRSSVIATIAADPEKQELSSSLAKVPIQRISLDTEKATPSDSELPSPLEGMVTHVDNVAITYQRPDVSAIIRMVVDETPVDKRVLVMGCGPDGLMKMVRNTAAECIRSDGPAVELHCEEFGW